MIVITSYSIHYTKLYEPTELSLDMVCELIDKIVIHEAVGKKPNRQQQIDIYYNFIGKFDLAYTAEEIETLKQKAEQELLAKKINKANRQKERNKEFQEKDKAERYAANDGHKFAKKICEWCGEEYWPNSSKQRFCTKACTSKFQKDAKDKKRVAEKGNHIFKQKECRICGKLFWPSNGQEVLCSEKCKKQNQREKQLAYYYRKKSEAQVG